MTSSLNFSPYQSAYREGYSTETALTSTLGNIFSSGGTRGPQGPQLQEGPGPTPKNWGPVPPVFIQSVKYKTQKMNCVTILHQSSVITLIAKTLQRVNDEQPNAVYVHCTLCRS